MGDSRGAPAFPAWLDGFLNAYYGREPVTATFIGVHEHDHRLPDASREGIADELAEIRALRRGLAPFSGGDELSAAEATDRDLAEGYLRIREWELASGRLHGNPAWYTGEAIFGLFSLLLAEDPPRSERLDALRSRLVEVPAFLAQARERVDDAPAGWIERAVAECGGALAFLTDGLGRVSESMAASDAAARAAEAFSGYRDWLRALLSSERRRRPAACGEEALALLLRCAHELPFGASEIASRAEQAIDESRRRLEDGAPDFRSELKRLEDLHPSRDGYYAAFESAWRESRRHAEAHRLLSWPEHPVDYVPRPGWSRAAAGSLYFLFYRSPAPLDPPARLRYLLPPIEDAADAAEAEKLLRATNDGVIKLNHVVHHGGIGHHAQNWHARRAPSRIGRIAAVDGASRIAMLSGGTMAEGWACYATDLMDETGFLTPLESFSQHHAHLRMAARALVDVRLHAGGMTPSEAERFYVETTAMSPAAARAEVVKNGMFPGAALIYLIGSRLIHELRDAVQAAEGAGFEPRRFHDRFLSHGSIPVSRIRRMMLGERT